MGRSRRVQQGCLYHIGGKSKFDAFTLGPDPEFTFVLFRCVSLAAVIILRAINRRASVQIASAMFKEPVAGKPEYVCLSNLRVLTLIYAFWGIVCGNTNLLKQSLILS